MPLSSNSWAVLEAQEAGSAGSTAGEAVVPTGSRAIARTYRVSVFQIEPVFDGVFTVEWYHWNCGEAAT